MLCFQPNWRGAEELPAALQDRVTVRRTTLIPAIFFLLAACAAWCQKRSKS